MIISYKQEAKRWGEALPLGNGHMGAMVYGGINERIDLTENTYFSGEASDYNNQESAAVAFQEMREAAKVEDFGLVEELSKEFIGIRNNYGTNLPVGSLYMDLLSVKSVLSDYTRGLALETGTAFSSFKVDHAGISRRCIVSSPDHLLLYEYVSNEPISIRIRYVPYGENPAAVIFHNQLSFDSYAHETMHSDGQSGTVLAGTILAQSNGSILSEPNKGTLLLSNFTEALILVDMDTNFKQEDTADRPADTTLSMLHQSLITHLEACLCLDAQTLFYRHSEDVSQFMNRVVLELPEDQEAALLFQYGRYLLLCSSREDSVLPAHLQGIWNDNVACRIGWTCDMHLDINTQMNYWPAQTTNLLESVAPLHRFIKNDLVPNGRIAALKSYGFDGWIGEIVTNAWGFAAPYWATPISPCPTGGIWILTHLWEQYQFTGDLSYLEDIYPLFKEAVVFFADYVFEKESVGSASCVYTCGPSISPENAFLKDGKKYYISNGCTYEILLIRELFTIYVEAYRVLTNHFSNVYSSDDTNNCTHDIAFIISNDASFVERIEQLHDAILPYRILRDGTLAEWDHDYPSADPQHRHTSHLLGLFPFAQITPERTPELALAAKSSLAAKLSPIEGWEDTGWARSMLLLYSARLKDGEAAFEHLHSMMRNLQEVNHFIIHPPTRGAGSFDNVYELDGNTGLTSGIAEMLLQSHDDCIQILPALPKSWKNGQVKGLLARGGITVDIVWQEGIPTSIVLVSASDTICNVTYPVINNTINNESQTCLKDNSSSNTTRLQRVKKAVYLIAETPSHILL